MTEGKVTLNGKNNLVVADGSTLSVLVNPQLDALSSKALNTTCVRNTQGDWTNSKLFSGYFLFLFCRLTFTLLLIITRKYQLTEPPQSLPRHLFPSHQHHQTLIYVLTVYIYIVGKALRLNVIDTTHVTNASNDHRIRHLLQHAIPPNWSLWLKDYLSGFYLGQQPESLNYCQIHRD